MAAKIANVEMRKRGNMEITKLENSEMVKNIKQEALSWYRNK